MTLRSDKNNSVTLPVGPGPSWGAMEKDEVLRVLNTGSEGLTSEEAERRCHSQGPNALLGKGRKGPWRILWDQWTSTMILILLAAGGLSFVVGDGKDAGVIFVVVFLNTLFGFTQEHKAEKSLSALKEMAVPRVRVRRDGRVREIPAVDLVPGDWVLVEAGNVIPADGRLLEAVHLRVQEASLTGESEPVDKDTELQKKSALPLGDQHNRVFMGTLASYGRGVFVVTETGMKTELGKIASLLQSSPPESTPLQRRLDKLGKQLAWVALGIVVFVFALGVLRGENLRLMFLTAVSLAVAAVPEGLPAVVTVALALGAQRMLKQRALIRKLPAVETLGSVNVICSDKTGTLTENRMTVTVLDVAGHRVDWDSGTAAQIPGTVFSPSLTLLVLGGALCNDAVLEIHRDGVRCLGDPTEGAFLLAAWRAGHHKEVLDRFFPRIAEAPFDSVRKRMTTVHRSPTGPEAASLGFSGALPWGDASFVSFSKGAVGSLLDVCTGVWVTDHREPMDAGWKERIQKANDAFAGSGIRVLGVGFRPWREDPTGPLDENMIFIGLVGMVDPPRPEVKEAVRLCQRAGIRPLMITGDHPLTAQHIARQLGFAGEQEIDFLTGVDLDRMTAGELERRIGEVSVFARVSPEHKLRIVEVLQKQGQNVAMTGDGVNDAPALKRADIGVAMGRVGTDVAKESADMVLLDDNFATIVSAIAEGRVIYDNIRKFMRYLLTTNSAEILVMVLGPLVGMPLPLLPLQILWINLITDGLPALALGLEPAERHIMDRPPVSPKEGLFARGLGLHVMWVGFWMSFLTVGVGFVFWSHHIPQWQTMLFTSLAFMQMAHVMAIRSERDSLFRQGLTSNPWLLGAVASTLGLQLAVVYIPFLQKVFGTEPLGLFQLGGACALGGVVFGSVEVEKYLLRKRLNSPRSIQKTH